MTEFIATDDGTRLAYHQYGSGEPILFMHGGFVSSKEWRPQVAALQDRWRLIVVDLRGHGESGRSKSGYKVEILARDMVRLLDRLGLESAFCVGHSLGGMVGQVMAREHAERVRALVLADTAFGISSTLWEGAQTWMARATFKVLSIKRIAQLSAAQLGARRPDVGPFIKAEMMQFARDKAHFHEILRAVTAFDSTPWLHEISCPTLSIVADTNQATRRQAVKMLDMIPSCKLEIIPHAGHMLHWDNPHAFNHALEAFLRAPHHPPRPHYRSPQPP